MKKATGFYPRVQVDAAGSGVVSQAGGVALVETVRASGIDRALRAALAPWCKPLAVHDPAKVVIDLAVTLALGGDALSDVAVLRAEPGVYGPVASDPTVSRTIEPWPRTPGGRWPRSTPPGPRPGPGCGPPPARTPPTPAPARTGR